MRTIDHIIIHCSATCEGSSLSVEELEKMHRRRGFRGIGYHYYIRRDGTVTNTRPLEVIGAHCKGNNAHSVGICYEGGLDARGNPKDTRTPEQRSAMHLLVAQLLKRFKNNVCICGHRDLSPDLNGDGVIEPEEWVKECPCFEVRKEL
ncbi:N-acetylmuramoyl-L-alanine amidase [Bacteroides stercorirosoris]|uniref:N-acetylmuramoyl-L-alanine amidase n=1 Tax=Bacteroides stercorirosoris TaxID=871324 RepID=A0A413H7P1_9BACE|nr:N-acetylmuramoyl-L-alanine amidase [Bacteroides stercorirosoris]RGX79642.1 N-acetylmuramoyl-L-alanine amidase [Bacteroides stercorirosoris]